MKSYSDTINKLLSIIEKTGSKQFFLCVFLVVVGIVILYLFKESLYKYIGIIFLLLAFCIALFLVYHFIREDNIKSLEKEYKKIIREKDMIINQLKNLQYSNSNTTLTKTEQFSSRNEEYQNSVSKNEGQTQNL